jgi:CxxH/CxxC protein (TIGR04129 family)
MEIIRFFACEEHVSYLMDDIIDEYEIAPNLEPVGKGEQHPCKWCGKTAKYIVEAQIAET